jgi:hypothetical protein
MGREDDLKIASQNLSEQYLKTSLQNVKGRSHPVREKGPARFAKPGRLLRSLVFENEKRLTLKAHETGRRLPTESWADPNYNPPLSEFRQLLTMITLEGRSFWVLRFNTLLATIFIISLESNLAQHSHSSSSWQLVVGHRAATGGLFLFEGQGAACCISLDVLRLHAFFILQVSVYLLQVSVASTLVVSVHQS